MAENKGKVNKLRGNSLNSIALLREIILKLYKQNATVIIDRSTIGITTADCTIWTAPQQSKAISRMLYFSPRFSINFSM